MEAENRMRSMDPRQIQNSYISNAQVSLEPIIC
jgi:hypothetical protein